MANGLAGKTVAIVVTNGVGQPELVVPRMAVAEEATRVDVVSLHEGDLQGVQNDIEPGDRSRSIGWSSASGA